MEGFGWIMTIILGGLAGWIAEKVMKFDSGLLVNILLGVAGAFVGNFILVQIGFGVLGGILGQIVVAVAGACLLIWIFRLFKQRSA